MLNLQVDLLFPVHSVLGVHALSYRLLGLCVLSCRAFSYRTTQDTLSHLNSILVLYIFLGPTTPSDKYP